MSALTWSLLAQPTPLSGPIRIRKDRKGSVAPALTPDPIIPAVKPPGPGKTLPRYC